MAVTLDGNGKHLYVGFQLNLWPIFKFKTHLWKLYNFAMLFFCDRFDFLFCLLADFLLVVNLLLGDYGSADFSVFVML